ncbi:hypothetical protein J2X31_000944 [Flavobacterium arsenatis]|uniref:Lipoprotein n=1 Tax=Flavobacterium arsenatis TaxID=1484332 RepID=A0ABU1TLU5_9FLAO|nr:hypothetical protein [Flavobacterium arsenatis]MDR6966944.1 hypothetical protein [Flavobacterium arsenatis]
MKKANSISLMILGCALLPIGILTENLFVKYSTLFTSILLNIIAIVLSFKEKNENK